ncbi:hypothetical protein D3C86_1898590 [compost metagenome]
MTRASIGRLSSARLTPPPRMVSPTLKYSAKMARPSSPNTIEGTEDNDSTQMRSAPVKRLSGAYSAI